MPRHSLNMYAKQLYTSDTFGMIGVSVSTRHSLNMFWKHSGASSVTDDTTSPRSPFIPPEAILEHP